MIEDVITTGGAVRDAHRLLVEAGATVLGVVCAIWRGAGDPRIDGLDAPVVAALTRDDLEAARSA
jgi:orotate phosphoribosyltransferase